MGDTNKLKAGGLNLNGVPDWVKIAVLLLTVFGAGGGGSHLLGRDYTPQFEKLDARLEAIEQHYGDLRERVVRLEVKLENLRNGK